MALPLLVTQAEALTWGFELTPESLKRASARVRGYLSQRVTAGTSTITARGPAFRLPERPVVSVESVLDEDVDVVDFKLAGSVLTVDDLGVVTVAYTHGLAELPEPLVELVCQVASRLDTIPAALTAGVQSEGTGPFSVSYGWDSHKAQAGLTQGEKDSLDRYWPRLPQIITVGAP